MVPSPTPSSPLYYLRPKVLIRLIRFKRLRNVKFVRPFASVALWAFAPFQLQLSEALNLSLSSPLVSLYTPYIPVEGCQRRRQSAGLMRRRGEGRKRSGGVARVPEVASRPRASRPRSSSWAMQARPSLRCAAKLNVKHPADMILIL